MAIFLRSLLKSGYFAECLTGERILVIGGAGFCISTETGDMYPLSYMYKYCMEHGALSCDKAILFYENMSDLEKADYFGDFVGLEKQYEEDTFDRVVVLSGLEMEDNPLLALRQLYRILRKNGKLNLILRTNNDLYVKYYLSEYEHKWRFTSDDISEIFIHDEITRNLKTANGDFLIIEVEKKYENNYILADRPLYSCRAGKYIRPDELYLLGYFTRYKVLEKIGMYEKSDKFRDHNYLDKYEFFLRPWRDKEFNFLELGIFKGGSARIWEKYFSNAMIYCVDINPQCAQYETERIKPIIMDLGIESEVLKLRNVKPEIIIDDASHFWNHQILALFTLFDILPNGGVYIMEDLETSVNQEMYPDFANGCPVDAYTILERINKVNVSKVPENDIDMFSEDVTRIGLRAEMISFIKGSCIIIKR